MYYNEPSKDELTDDCYSLDYKIVNKYDHLYLFDNQSYIAVYGMEGMVEPHFHIVTVGYPDICIKTFKNEYFGKPSVILNDDQCKKLNEFMHTKIDKFLNITCWKSIMECVSGFMGNISYSYEDLNNLHCDCPNYNHIAIDEKYIEYQLPRIYTPFGDAEFKLYDPNNSSLISAILETDSGKKLVKIDLIDKIITINKLIIQGLYRNDLFHTVNYLMNSKCCDSGLYLYQKIIMKWMHEGHINGHYYMDMYYDYRKFKSRYISDTKG